MEYFTNKPNTKNNKSYNIEVKKLIERGEKTVRKGQNLILQTIQRNLPKNVNSKDLVGKLKKNIEDTLTDISGIVAISVIISMKLNINKMSQTEATKKFIDAVYLTQINIKDIKQNLGLKNTKTKITKHTELLSQSNNDFMTKILPIMDTTSKSVEEVIELSLSKSVKNPRMLLKSMNIALISMTNLLRYSMIIYISNPSNKIDEIPMSDRLNLLEIMINTLENKILK
jgi:hypothetical protein